MTFANHSLKITKNGKTKTLSIVGDITPMPRKNLIINFNEMKDNLGLCNGKDLEENMFDITSSNGLDYIGSMVELLFLYENKINDYSSGYEVQEDELKSLDDDDFRHHYYEGDKTYNEEDYKGLIKMKYKMVLVIIGSLLVNPLTHPNIIITLLQKHNIILHDESFDRVKRFIISHSNMRPANLIDIGELMNVIPLEKNIELALSTVAIVKLASSNRTSVISSVYSVVRDTRNPKVEFTTKPKGGGDKETSWVSSFRQISTITLGQVGEYQEYLSNIEELKYTFNINKEEDYLIKESNDMCEVLKGSSQYGNYINLGNQVGYFIDPLLVNILPLNLTRYLDIEQLVNIIAIAYVLAMRVSKDLAYTIHTQEEITNSSFLDKEYSQYQGMGKNPTKNEVKELANKFFGDDSETIDIAKQAYSEICYKDFSMSLKTLQPIDSYPTMKPDYCKYLTSTIVGLH